MQPRIGQMKTGQKTSNNNLIAIIDDDPVFERKVSKALMNAGFRVVVITSGFELLSILSIDRPSAIIIDTMLSWIDGLQLVDALRRNPFLSDVRVLFTSREKGERDRRFEDFEMVYKPVDIDRLIDRLREMEERDEPA